MRRTVVFAVAAVALCGCTSTGEPAGLTPTDVSALRVVAEREQVPAYSAYLAPDGNRLLYNSEDGVCVRGVDGSGQRCSPAAARLDTASASWSPDGSLLALTDAHLFGREPDVWVYDVANGDLTNLTDDGVEAEDYDLTDPEVLAAADLDLFPSWSPDGTRIRFLRRADATTVDVMSIPAGGGVARREGSVPTAWAELRAVAWSAERFAWLSGPAAGGSGSVLTSGVRGGAPRELIDGDYPVLSFSSDGRYLLVDKRGADGAPSVGKARVVPVAGGDPVPVAAGEVTYPTWAPRGHGLGYVDGPDTLRVVARPGDEPKELYRGKLLGAADLDNLDWAPGALLLTTARYTPVVLTLAR